MDHVLDGALAARRFVHAGPRERLLLLLHADFGDRTGLDRSDFRAWASHPKLISLIDDLVEGRLPPDYEARNLLRTMIEPRLIQVDDLRRAGLATEMAEALLRAYPLALREYAEFGQLLAARPDPQSVEPQLDEGTVNGELSQMLLSGSFESTRQIDAAQRVDELVKGEQYEAAAAALLEIGSAFEGAQSTGLAESYLLRAAAMYERAGRTDAAVRLLEEVAHERVAQRAPDAVATVRELERLAGSTPSVRGLLACANWPELGYAADWLRRAIRDEQDPERRLRFQAALVEVGSVMGDSQTVLADSADVGGGLEAAPRLAIELDRISALESSSPREADLAWAAVEEWAADAGDATSKGRCWARRGLQLAYRGDLAGACRAYRTSMAAWAEAPDGKAHVADAYLSARAAALLLDTGGNTHSGPAPAAGSAQEAVGAPIATARRLQDSATVARVSYNSADAHRNYWLALAEYRACGSLHGVLAVTSQLAELYFATGRTPAAISMLVSTGKGKEAAQLASELPPSSVAAAMATGGAPWHRAATYDVLAALGPRAPGELVALFMEQLVADSERMGDALPPGLSAAAERALASVARQPRDAL